MKIKLIIMVASFILLVGCARDTEPLRLGTMPTYSASIYAVGIEKGFFEEAGVQVDLTVFRSARDRDAAATAGQLDGFMTDMMGAVVLNDKGFDFRITSREYEEFAIMARPDMDLSNITSAKVGISENSIVDYVVDAYVEETVDKVAIVAVPDRMGALLNGELDLGVFPQPFIGIIMGQGGQKLLSTVNLDFHPVVLVFDNLYLEENGKQVEAFYEGYKKTLEYMKSTPYDDYKDALVVHGLATEETVDLYRLPLDSYTYAIPKKEDYDAIIAWMLEKGLVQSPLSFEAIHMDPMK